MEGLKELAYVVARQAISTSPPTAAATAIVTTGGTGCQPNNDYDGRIGLRISAIFVILVGSSFGKSAL